MPATLLSRDSPAPCWCGLPVPKSHFTFCQRGFVGSLHLFGNPLVREPFGDPGKHGVKRRFCTSVPALSSTCGHLDGTPREPSVLLALCDFSRQQKSSGRSLVHLKLECPGDWIGVVPGPSSGRFEPPPRIDLFRRGPLCNRCGAASSRSRKASSSLSLGWDRHFGIHGRLPTKNRSGAISHPMTRRASAAVRSYATVVAFTGFM